MFPTFAIFKAHIFEGKGVGGCGMYYTGVVDVVFLSSCPGALELHRKINNKFISPSLQKGLLANSTGQVIEERLRQK